jgi:hypothetical protein
MRKLILTLSLLTISILTFSQNIKLKLADVTTNTNINGQPINKGDMFDVVVFANGNGNTTTRSIYFDFEYQNTAFNLISINHTGTGGNGGVLPSGANITLDYFQYPGYTWLSNANNTTSNGNINYNFANYNYVQNGPKTIVRSNLIWASNNGMPYSNFDKLLILRFQLKPNAPGFVWDPIKMNFGAAFNQNGSTGATEMTVPLTNVITLDPIATSYVNAKIETNNNMSQFTLTRVMFLDSITNQGYIVDATSDGKLNIDQSKLKPNTTYKVMAMVNMDSMYDLYNAAVTVSDYTTAQAEYITQNLDGTFKNQNIKTGMGYLVADINRNKIFDGGDVVKLFSQSVSVDQLISLPSQYEPGKDSYMSVPTFTENDFNNLNVNNWKEVNTPVVTFRTGNIGTNLPLNLKYALWGDVNRSHSSQVIQNGTIQTNAKVSLMSSDIKTNELVNTTTNIPSINVNINNITVTSNNIEIPIKINTGTNKVSALQFGFTYDQTKIKFDELQSQLPEGWFIFGTPKDGFIKFGAIDKSLVNHVVGELVPFKLKFTSLINGLDISTQIKITSIMDAADNKGNQLGIKLNTTSIKLTGYNNFNK